MLAHLFLVLTQCVLCAPGGPGFLGPPPQQHRRCHFFVYQHRGQRLAPGNRVRRFTSYHVCDYNMKNC